MVKVEIVEEKDQTPATNSPYASSSSSRTSSTTSLVSEASENETFFQRIAALVDIVPPATRYKLYTRVSQTASTFKSLGKFAGNVVWIVTTSALLVGLPLALSLEDEAKIVAQEKEVLSQQQGAQQVRFSPLTLSLSHQQPHRIPCPPTQMLGGYPQPGSDTNQKALVPPGF